MRNTLFLLALAAHRSDLRRPENAWLLNELVFRLLEHPEPEARA